MHFENIILLYHLSTQPVSLCCIEKNRVKQPHLTQSFRVFDKLTQSFRVFDKVTFQKSHFSIRWHPNLTSFPGLKLQVGFGVSSLVNIFPSKKFTILKFVLQGVFVTLKYPPPPVIVQRKEKLIITYLCRQRSPRL